MAGSKLWFAYTTDAGTVYGINLDEDNTKEINGAVGRPLPAGLTDALPRNIKPRRVYYKSAEGNRTISCVALTPAVYAGIPAAHATIPDPINTTNDALLYLRKAPEVTRGITRGDSGLTDGTDDPTS